MIVPYRDDFERMLSMHSSIRAHFTTGSGTDLDETCISDMADGESKVIAESQDQDPSYSSQRSREELEAPPTGKNPTHLSSVPCKPA